MSKGRGWPRSWQMPGPLSSAKFANAGKCPAVARGGGGGAVPAQLELTDA